MINGDVNPASLIVAPVSVISPALTINQPTGSTGVFMFNIISSGGTGIGGINSSMMAYGNVAGDVCTGRLTLSSTDPCPTADQTSNTIYYLPYKGRGMITLYNIALGQFETWPIQSGISYYIGGWSAGSMMDLFVGVSNLGAMGFGVQGWTDQQTRSLPLLNIGDYWYHSTSIGSRYVGTVYVSGTGTATDSVTIRGIWNMCNRVPRPLISTCADYSWVTGITPAWGYANNSSAYHSFQVVNGHVFPQFMEVCAYSTFYNTAGAAFRAIGVNSNTFPIYVYAQNNDAVGYCMTTGPHLVPAPTGYGLVSAIDRQQAWSGTSTGYWSNNILTGLIMS